MNGKAMLKVVREQYIKTGQQDTKFYAFLEELVLAGQSPLPPEQRFITRGEADYIIKQIQDFNKKINEINLIKKAWREEATRNIDEIAEMVKKLEKRVASTEQYQMDKADQTMRKFDETISWWNELKKQIEELERRMKRQDNIERDYTLVNKRMEELENDCSFLKGRAKKKDAPAVHLDGLAMEVNPDGLDYLREEMKKVKEVISPTQITISYKDAEKFVFGRMTPSEMQDILRQSLSERKP